jgi:hypothetical protein
VCVLSINQQQPKINNNNNNTITKRSDTTQQAIQAQPVYHTAQQHPTHSVLLMECSSVVPAFSLVESLNVDLQRELIASLSKGGLSIWRAAVAIGCTCRAFRVLVYTSPFFKSIGSTGFIDSCYLKRIITSPTALEGAAKDMPFDWASSWFWIERVGKALTPTVAFLFIFASNEKGRIHQLEYKVIVDTGSFVAEVVNPPGWRRARALHNYQKKSGNPAALPPLKMLITSNNLTSRKDLKLLNVDCTYRTYPAGVDPAEGMTRIISAPARFSISVECAVERHPRTGYKRFYYDPTKLDVSVCGAFPRSNPGIAHFLREANVNLRYWSGEERSDMGLDFTFGPEVRTLAGFDPEAPILRDGLRNKATSQQTKKRGECSNGYVVDKATGDYVRVPAGDWNIAPHPLPEVRKSQKRDACMRIAASAMRDDAASDDDVDPERDFLPAHKSRKSPICNNKPAKTTQFSRELERMLDSDTDSDTNERE